MAQDSTSSMDVDLPAVQELYRQFSENNMAPLWTQMGDLVPTHPQPRAVPWKWSWSRMHALAKESGDLIPVGRGGERRAIALANPGLGGAPYATASLWCAIQWLGPRETAPEHRHSQNALRFVVEGEGVWTVVDGDPVHMRRGDLLMTPGWNFHGHYNNSDEPMAWIDALDLPFSHYMDVGFFEFGSEKITDRTAPSTSRSERLWSYPGLLPATSPRSSASTPIAAYRWEQTDKALNEQLALEQEGFPPTIEAGHAAVRYSNPITGGDVLPTIRAEFHRLRAGTRTKKVREVGSSVWQVFDGAGTVMLDGVLQELDKGDVFVVPSWAAWSLAADSGLDLFRFSDAPIIEALGFQRQWTESEE